MNKIDGLQKQINDLKKKINIEKDKPKKEIANKLKAIRKNMGESQASFADYMNIERTSYVMIENASSWLSVRNLILICEALSLSSDELLGITKANTIKLSLETGKITPREFLLPNNETNNTDKWDDMSDDKELNIEYCLRRDLDVLRAMNDSKNKELTTLRRDIKDRLDDMYSMYDLWKEQNNQRQGSEWVSVENLHNVRRNLQRGIQLVAKEMDSNYVDLFQNALDELCRAGLDFPETPAPDTQE